MTAEQNDNNIQAPPVIGPGEKLRNARLAAGLDKDRVAAQLHLKPEQIDELERDHFDGFAARVFVRGYLRNYARLVDLSADEILDAFEAASPDPDEPRLKRVGSHKPQVSSRHGLVRLISWLLALGIVGLFGVWWAGYLELNGNGQTAQPTVEAPAPASPQAEDTQPPGALSLPPPAVEAQPKPEPVAEPPATTEPQPEPAPAEPVAETPAQADEVAGGDVSEPVPAAAPQAGDTELGESGNNIVLTLTAPCWVEVRATDGSFKLLGTFDAGTRKVLGGNPPYRILLGNAAAATLTIDGEVFDLAPHTRQQVARFELDPAAL